VERVRRYTVLAILVLLAVLSACDRARRYPLVGQVIAVNSDRQEITVKHDDIRGFMPGMTMPFRVKDAAQVAASKPGDLIRATLVVEDTRGYLENIAKTGEAPLPEGAANRPPPILEPGAEVPDAEFVDQDGRTRRLSDWKGQVRAVTFVYTRCPLPDFCPLMDRHFAAVQKALQTDDRLASRVHLFSVSFDPDHDTPKVLKQHADRVGADPEIWTYLTGSRDAIDRFAGAFGVAIMREDGKMTEIIHNLRTAVIDADGRLIRILNGNEWKPEELLAAIRAADARR
jgi:protein SCO1/2